MVVAVLSGSKVVCGEDPRSSFLVVMTALFDRVYGNYVFVQWVVPSAMLLWLSGFKAEVSTDMAWLGHRKGHNYDNYDYSIFILHVLHETVIDLNALCIIVQLSSLSRKKKKTPVPMLQVSLQGSVGYLKQYTGRHYGPNTPFRRASG